MSAMSISAMSSTLPAPEALLLAQTLPAPPLSGIVRRVVEHSTQALAVHDDQTLLYLIGQGNRSAFHAFYQRHAGRTLALLRQMCRDAVVAEDLLQEIFLLVWRKAGSYHQERGDPLGWLFAVARNKLIDHRRRFAGKAEDDLLELPVQKASRENRELELAIRQAMASLTLDQQQALRMTYYGGYTYEEAADQLKVPLGTLKSRIKTGLRRLRHVLEANL